MNSESAAQGMIRDALRLRLRILGPLEIETDGVAHPVTQRRERNILAMLIASHGQPLSAERLIDQLWSGKPPPRASTSVQVAILRLRQMIEPRRARRAAGEHLISVTGGYALRVDERAVDGRRFTSEARRAAVAEPQECVARSEAILADWRGTPYADCADTKLVRAEVDLLLETRLALLEARAGALLALGHADRVDRELSIIVQEHPFRERLWSLLALSQYQNLRQADALATLRTLRERLSDELGVDPSAELRELETAILNQAASVSAAERIDLQAVTTDATQESRHDPGLAGRTDAVASLTGAVDRLVDGRGGSVIISGEAGIGKSHLAARASSYAKERGVTVLVGRCHEGDVAPAYWPWLPVLRELISPSTPAEVIALLDAGSEGGTSDGGAAALRTYDAVGQLLRDAGRQRRLLIVVEDLHWADTSSLRMLTYVAEAADAPVLFVATRRTSERAGSSAFTAALASLARSGALRIHLDGLGLDDVSLLLRRELGPHEQALAEVVAERTEGNPFFVIEFARLLKSERISDPDQVARIPVPEGIGDVLRLRLQRLPAEAQRLLPIAAVAGRAVDPRMISAVSDFPMPAVLDVLDVAQAAGLLNGADNGYSFRHDLVRETVYADLPAGRRSHLHAAVADVLQRRLAADPEIRTELAHHYRLAAPLDGRYAARAVEHLRAAAQLADARNASDESAVLWRQAVAAHALTAMPEPLERQQLLVAQAVAELRTSEIVAARSHIAEAVAIGLAEQRWDLAGGAATALTRSGVWAWREYGTTDATMIDALAECLRHLPDGPLAARVLATLQMEYYYARRLVEADNYGRRSVAMARTCGDPAVLVQVLLVRALGTWGPGTYTERIALGEEMLTLPLVGEAEVGALFQYGVALDEAGRVAEADTIMERCRAAAARLRHTAADIPIAWWQFMRAVECDDPARQAKGDAALDLHRRSAVVTIDEISSVHAIRTAALGAHVPSDVVTRAAASRNPGFRALVAHAMTEAGDVDGAIALLGAAAVGEAPDYAVLASDCLRTAVFAVAGMTAQVRTSLDRITEWSGDVVLYGSVDHLGAVDFFIAVGLTALGSPELARNHAQAAVDLCHDIGNQPWGRRARAQVASLAQVTAG